MACSSDAEQPQSAPGASQGNEAAPNTAEPPPVEWGTAVTDGQILEVLAAVDTAEIEQAQVALAKAQSPRVREFATHMLEEHNASKRAGEQVAAAAGATRSGSAFSLSLKSKAAKVLQTLNASDAAAFDHSYMMSQVQQHEEVLKLLTERMIPAASSSPAREHATKAQTMVQHHLERAWRRHRRQQDIARATAAFCRPKSDVCARLAPGAAPPSAATRNGRAHMEAMEGNPDALYFRYGRCGEAPSPGPFCNCRTS
jgi:putative membrane protein